MCLSIINNMASRGKGTKFISVIRFNNLLRIAHFSKQSNYSSKCVRSYNNRANLETVRPRASHHS